MTRSDEDRFERHGELGRGATASVHLARDHERGHMVALTVLHAHLVGDPSARRRLEREVRTAALVQHEAALVPYELHELEEGTALSMPFHPGETLGARIADRGPMGHDAVRAMGRRLAGSLVAAHRAGGLHRDLSPNNVLLGEASDAVLTDFGLARVAGSPTATATGVWGIAGYAAPELLDGERGDPRSGLYALGAVLYLAVTGTPPFAGAKPVAALRAQLDGDFRPVRELAPSCPKDLARTIEALLESDPARRPQGAPDVLELLEGRIPSTPPPRRAEARSAPPRGGWWVEVRERSTDVDRRRKLREASRQGGAQRRWVEVGEAIGRSLESGLRSLVGLDPAVPVAPEEQLAEEVRQLGFDVHPQRLLEASFTLVGDVDEGTARRLAQRATELGFEADARDAMPGTDLVSGWVDATWIWAVAGLLFVFTEIDVWVFLVAFALMPAARSVRTASQRRQADTSDEVAVVGRPHVAEADSTPVRQDVGHRAEVALDALEEALAGAELPEVAARDLSTTHAELRRLAEGATCTLRSEVHAPAGLDGDVAQMEHRRTRILALRSAGQGRPGELVSVDQALDAQRQALLAADRADGERVAAMAQLVEIACTADRVRFERAAGPRSDVGEATDRLRRGAKALRAARQELARKGGR